MWQGLQEAKLPRGRMCHDPGPTMFLHGDASQWGGSVETAGAGACELHKCKLNILQETSAVAAADSNSVTRDALGLELRFYFQHNH